MPIDPQRLARVRAHLLAAAALATAGCGGGQDKPIINEPVHTNEPMHINQPPQQPTANPATSGDPSAAPPATAAPPQNGPGNG